MIFINDTNGLTWINEPNFKIRSKTDAEKFLTKLIRNTEYQFRVYDAAIETEWTFGKGKNGFYLDERFGTYGSPFIPSFERSNDMKEIAAKLYKYRKIINKQFFTND